MSKPFRISHSFKVSRDTLWAVYTQPEHLTKWFGPQGFTMPAYDMEFRVGGVFLHALQAPDGTQMWGKWEFLGIEAPSRLSLIQQVAVSSIRAIVDSYYLSIRVLHMSCDPIAKMQTTEKTGERKFRSARTRGEQRKKAAPFSNGLNCWRGPPIEASRTKI
jgi:uncharacterized protein YndB with AHSA1/START domain